MNRPVEHSKDMTTKTTLTRNLITAALAYILLSAAAVPARAQQAQSPQEQPTAAQGKPAASAEQPAAGGKSEEELRKEAQNPIASLISVPIQENFNFNIGPANRTQNVLNIQPVIPVSLSKDWNLIIRWITPVIYQPYAVNVPQPPGPPVQVQTGVYGLGDMQPAFFFSPKKSKVTWGVGPQLLLPTATNTSLLGQGKFGMGPTAVAWVQPGKWTA